MDVVHPVHQIVLPPVAHVLEFAVQTCGNMEDVDLVLNQLDELERLIKVHSVRMNFVGGDTVFDNEILAAKLADSVQHLYGKARPVFEGTAVVVLALVIEGTRKLGDQVPVTAVDHAHFEARPLAAVCGDGILFDGLLYLCMIHLYGGDGFPAVHLCAPYFTGSNEGGGAEGRFPGFIEVRILPVVVDLERGERSIAVAHFDKAGERKDAGVAAEVELTLLVTRLFDIDHGIADVELLELPLRLLRSV